MPGATGTGFTLTAIKPKHVAAYIELLTSDKAAPTVKQHLAAIRMYFDWLTSGGNLDFNPASSVRGPKYLVTRGKTPVLSPDQDRTLLDSIPLKIGPEQQGGEPMTTGPPA